MPYRKTYRRRYNRRRPTVKRLIRREIAKNNNKQNPINYFDLIHGGIYIKTTPQLDSVGKSLATHIDDTNLYDASPTRYDQQNNQIIRVIKLVITGIAYQYRFQQNDSAVDAYTDSVRTLLYQFNDTWNENTNALMSGSDIDQPPNTLSVVRMIYDKIFHLRAGLTETSGDDNQFVPGTKIVKGFKKLYIPQTYEYNQATDICMQTEGTDLRFEHGSDDNSVVGEVELYGYYRVYFRIVN